MLLLSGERTLCQRKGAFLELPGLSPATCRPQWQAVGHAFPSSVRALRSQRTFLTSAPQPPPPVPARSPLLGDRPGGGLLPPLGQPVPPGVRCHGSSSVPRKRTGCSTCSVCHRCLVSVTVSEEQEGDFGVQLLPLEGAAQALTQGEAEGALLPGSAATISATYTKRA